MGGGATKGRGATGGEQRRKATLRCKCRSCSRASAARGRWREATERDAVWPGLRRRVRRAARCGPGPRRRARRAALTGGDMRACLRALRRAPQSRRAAPPRIISADSIRRIRFPSLPGPCSRCPSETRRASSSSVDSPRTPGARAHHLCRFYFRHASIRRDLRRGFPRTIFRNGESVRSECASVNRCNSSCRSGLAVVREGEQAESHQEKRPACLMYGAPT
jgi:hypothetical protein